MTPPVPTAPPETAPHGQIPPSGLHATMFQPSDPPPAVTVERVSRVFGATRALDDVSLSVRRGEFLSLLGPSGCGKTTLLRMIGGFDRPDAGRILIDGEDATRIPPNRRRSNMIFQHLALFPHMTVAENVGFSLSLRRAPAAETARRVEESLAQVQLAGFGDRRIDQLSGGQKQRVAIARALINEPAVLLLDEPLGALDLQLRLKMQDELRELHRRLGSTFVFVTHDQGEAMAMSDRIAVMDAGRILQLGTPDEIYDRPANAFVARFVGHANIFEGEVVAVAGGLATVEVNGVQLVGRAPEAARPGARATVSIRHEAVHIADDDRPPRLCGRVVERVPTGPTVRLTLMGETGLRLRAEPARQSAAGRTVQEGDVVQLTWDAEAVQVFVAPTTPQPGDNR